MKMEPEPKKDELLVLWHKECLQSRKAKRKHLKVSKTDFGTESAKGSIKLDLEKVPELYHPSASSGRMALWCPPLGFTSPHFLETPRSPHKPAAYQTARSREETPRALSSRSSIPLTSRSDTLLSTKEACWAESLRTTPASGGTSSNFLRALAPLVRQHHRPADASSPRARREELMAYMARAGHAAGSLSALDPPPPAATASPAAPSPAERVLGRLAPPPPPPMVFKRPRPALLDESLTTTDISREWYFQQQELRARGRLSWTRADR